MALTFETKYAYILESIKRIDPVKYCANRNFIDGDVTYLSPYISRGVISTRQVLEAMLAAGHDLESIEKFIQELAWRDYWQQLWIAHKDDINNDFKQAQIFYFKDAMPKALFNHTTGIEAIDDGIAAFYESGYLHNHLRMYVASIACNIGQYHWKVPAQWMYYHLLDADWASNALSWQWVCAANSNKRYYANQENINRYCHTSQRNTFLDVDYEDFDQLAIPDVLRESVSLELITPLPVTSAPTINRELPTLIYNFYNIDPTWRSNIEANRVLLLEPSVFEKYPVSQRSIDFCIALAQDNIPNVHVFVGEFDELKSLMGASVFYKEHPLNSYEGTEDPRDWMTNVKGSYPSFFAFWKKCRKELIG